MKRNEFRIELFYRLNVVPIHMPPLRERIEDIPLLVKHFIGIFNKNLNKNIQHISKGAMGQLMDHHWPGNVRELENVLERAFISADGDTIDYFMFSQDMNEDRPRRSLASVDIDIPFMVAKSMAVKRFEKSYLLEALSRYNGNVSETARKTGVNARTLWRKINDYGLERRKYMRQNGL
jgi:DNA-binding NtrC family response regulator